MTDRLATPAAAALIGVATNTLEHWRAQGRGPAYHRLAGSQGRIFYARVDVEAWLDAQRVDPGAAA